MTIDYVLWVALTIQVGLFVRSFQLARADDSDALDSLRVQFEDDVIDRASRGDGPDWVRYMDEGDRVHERRIDRLRVWATAALVVGIGGTMAALAIGSAVQDIEQQSSSAALAGLIAAISPALMASLAGVLNNLLITLVLFHISDKRFEDSLNEFRNALRECSARYPPHEKFTDAVRDQLGIAFREAVRTFPDAFAQLGSSVKELGEVNEAQSKALLAAASGLMSGANSITGAVSEIPPVAALLRLSIDELSGLPNEIGQMLDETRARWEEEIRRDQESFTSGVIQVVEDQGALLEIKLGAFENWEQKRHAAVELLQKSVSGIEKTVEDLPATFAREVGRAADTMGKEFGLEARQHVGDLTSAIRDGNNTLREHLDQTALDLQNHFLNDTSKVVADTYTKVYGNVEDTLLKSLSDVQEGFMEAVKTLPDNAKTFAASLTTADKKLQQSIERLKEAADHLERVAKLSEEFETSLTNALRDSTTEALGQFRSQMQDIETGIRSLAERSGPKRGVLRRFFRKLTRRGRRGGVS